MKKQRMSIAYIAKRLRPLRLFLLLLLAVPAQAHIGSPDTFVQAAVGPYQVLLAAHPPAVTPGALELDLRFNPDDHLTAATASLDDAPPAPIQLFRDGTASTSLWVATPQAHVLHLTVQGGRGPGSYTVTLPASAGVTDAGSQPCLSFADHCVPSRPLRWLLPLLLLFAALFMARNRLRRRPVLAITLLAVLLAVAVYACLRPASSTTTVTANLTPNGHLLFTLHNSSERFDDLAPDHGKLMHLFLIRSPGNDVFLHLHPVQLSAGSFDAALPAMPPGTYTLFADFYHRDARSETATLRLTLPQQSHNASHDPDDSTAVIRQQSIKESSLPTPPQDVSSRPATERSEGEVERPASAPPPNSGVTTTYTLPDHYTLQLQTPTHLTPLHANLLVATLLDPQGQAPADMALYLGMTAHAVVLRDDDQVFAHIHPGGTLPMLMPANAPMDMSMPMPTPSNTATIPYGFPSAGRYRVFVQMKHGRIVETGAFNFEVR